MIPSLQKFFHLQEQALSVAGHINENFHLGNISSINTLIPGRLVILLHPGKKKKKVLLGEGKISTVCLEHCAY